MISDGAFSIFKRFSAREKAFHEMPERRMRIFGGVGGVQSRYNFSDEKSLDWRRCSKVQGVQRKFKMFKEVQMFNAQKIM
jgi:hypothetical protein